MEQRIFATKDHDIESYRKDGLKESRYQQVRLGEKKYFVDSKSRETIDALVIAEEKGTSPQLPEVYRLVRYYWESDEACLTPVINKNVCQEVGKAYQQKLRDREPLEGEYL